MKQRHLHIIGLLFVIVILSMMVSKEKKLIPLNDFVRIEKPQEGDRISSPLLIKGEARGNWYFEANFPVFLMNEDGRMIASHYAEAEGEWMTEEFVPFTATIEFVKPSHSDFGTLILGKSNASGLPEHDDQVEIPIRF